jgi:glyoxylase-like metal-dependent hydrolase (beta-lactamase superfamily II)
VHIESEGQHALITGDCIHHPCQIANLDWSSSADYAPEQGIETRKKLMQDYADTEILIIGTHFATPTAGLLKRDGDNYWLDVNI